jgi:TolB-like protein/Tfp pilus assembly protein PilF
VLPFQTAGAREEDEYLGDGIAEGIIGKLCGLQGIERVLAWHSVARFKGRDVDPVAVGNELGVDAVLAGKIDLRLSAFLVSAELVSTRRGDRIWGQRFSRQLEDIIEIEDTISTAIAESLRLELSEGDRERIVKRSTDHPEAYRLYLKGRHLWNRRTRESLERSIELYHRAISLDDRFALAFTGIADAWVSLAWNDFIPKRTAFKEALSASLTALEIDDSVAESHVSLGGILVYLGADWQRAEKEYLRAIVVNPNSAEAYHQYAHLLSFTDRADEAISMMNRAVDLEPVSRIISSCCGQVHYFARRYGEAASHLETAIELDPANAGPYSWLGMVHVQRDDCDQAEKAFNRGLEAGTFVTRNTGAVGYCHGIHGETERALAQLERLNELSKETPVDPCFEAWIHTGLGDVENALNALERAYAADANWLVALKVDPFFERLRDEPRFKDLLRRMNLAED